MEDQLYREIILENWQNPQNYGEVSDATFAVDGHNPICGDQIHLTGKVADGKLVDVAFSGQGCAISKASASVFTDHVKGMTIADIQKITPEQVLENLEVTLTPARTKCALLVYSTLKKTQLF